MYQNLHLICLRTVNYDDKSAILAAYSRELGRVAFKVPTGASREGRRRRALTMPLGMVECTADVRSGREILTMRDVRPMQGVQPVATGSPVKMAIAAFLAEVLCTLLRERAGDEPLFDYIAGMTDALGTMQKGVANFHLMFLYRLTRFVGIEPDTCGYVSDSVFDMRDGVFRASVPMHGQYLAGNDARAVLMLSRMRPGNLHFFRMNRDMRNRIVDGMLAYYGRHLGINMEEIRSKDVLRCLF